MEFTLIIGTIILLIILKLNKKKNKSIYEKEQKNENIKTFDDFSGHTIEDSKFELNILLKDNDNIKHIKKEYLTTKNEQKLFFALLKVLDSHKYMIHCQTSLIALVEPVEYEDKRLAWSKRMDFVITDKTTKILAVIELDDSSHNSIERIERDEYVNQALNEHHPFIRIQSDRFYRPENIANLLEAEAGIKNTYLKNNLSIQK